MTFRAGKTSKVNVEVVIISGSGRIHTGSSFSIGTPNCVERDWKEFVGELMHKLDFEEVYEQRYLRLAKKVSEQQTRVLSEKDGPWRLTKESR